MTNTVTQAELAAAIVTRRAMSENDLYLMKDMMAEAQFERKAAFGGQGLLAAAFVEETKEPVSAILYELCYKARVAKLFEERDSLHKVLDESET